MSGAPPSLFTTSRRARRRRWGLWARLTLTVVLVALAVAAVSAVGLWQYARSRIDRQVIPALEETTSQAPGRAAAMADPAGDPAPASASAPEPQTTPTPQASPSQPIDDEARNVLVVGTDTRDGLTAQELLEDRGEAAGTQLTDTVLLVQFTPAREQTAILSFPGDLGVTPPGHERMKLQAVHRVGGPDLLVRTLEDYTGLEFDHYAEVEVAGFVQLTDVLGGVEMCLDEPIVDRSAGVDLSAGCQVVDSEQALGFVRSRSAGDPTGSDDGFDRLARQRHFVRHAMSEATSVGTLLNPLRLKRIVDVVAENVVTDEELGVADLWRLAGALEGIREDDIDPRVVPGYWDPTDTFTHVYPEQAEALFQALRQGARLPEVGRTDPRDNELTADQVEVLVLNGVGKDGLAGEVAGYLEARDFVVVGSDNVKEFQPDMATTTVAHGPEAASKGQLVAQYLPGAKVVELQQPPATADVVVTVANDWRDT